MRQAKKIVSPRRDYIVNNLNKEQQDSLLIHRKMEEIKNAEKQLKIAEREYLFLSKKERRLKDESYL